MMEKITVPLRMTFPEDEKKFLWLPLLLDAYAIINKGVELAIHEAERKTGEGLACKKGCGSCCTAHKDIPIYPLEIVGIYWYATEKIGEPLRGILKQTLSAHKKENCPFLVERLCAIHPLRPISCRQFNVFGKACSEGEDPYHTRRDDVLVPLQEYVDNAFFITLPFYGVTDEKAREEVIKGNFIHTQVRILQSVNWGELLRVMNEFDSRSKTV